MSAATQVRLGSGWKILVGDTVVARRDLDGELWSRPDMIKFRRFEADGRAHLTIPAHIAIRGVAKEIL